MANTTSQLMTNNIAVPHAFNSVVENHARVRRDVCRVTAVAGDGAGHLYRLTKMSALYAVQSVKLANGADAGFTDMNVGIYTPSSDTADPVAIDADGLVDGFDASSAQLTPLEILGTGTGAGDPADFGKALWEFAPAGPATKPQAGTEYEIVVQSVGNPAGADAVFIIEYTAGD